MKKFTKIGLATGMLALLALMANTAMAADCFYTWYCDEFGNCVIRWICY